MLYVFCFLIWPTRSSTKFQRQIAMKNSSQRVNTQRSFNKFLQQIIKKYFKLCLVELIPISSF